MTEKIKQYRNLILLSIMVLVIGILLFSDPVGFFTGRAHYKAQIQNQIAVEKAETEKQIAIIKAETEAEERRIRGEINTVITATAEITPTEE